jgi:transposase InsO family protein
LRIAPSGYRRQAAQQRAPNLLCARARRDAIPMPEIQRVWDANMQAEKLWRQHNREGAVGVGLHLRLNLARLAVRGVRDRRVRPAHRVGWRVSHSMRTDFVPDALEQALYAREPEHSDALVHHSDRGSQYVCIRYTERLAEAGIEPSVGSRGDSDDNALAETINGLSKAELIRRRAPRKSREAVEIATLEWVAWFNHHRLLESIGYIPPAEAEANYYRQLAERAESPACT